MLLMFLDTAENSKRCWTMKARNLKNRRPLDTDCENTLLHARINTFTITHVVPRPPANLATQSPVSWRLQ